MGISTSKSKQTNTPWAPAQPYIIKGLENSGRVFDQQQPSLDKYSAMQMATYGRLAPGAETGIGGAQGLVNDTLAGKYLQGNPYLDRILATTRENITNDVNGQFSGAGRYGSGMHAGVLAKYLADAENQARYNKYATERGYNLRCWVKCTWRYDEEFFYSAVVLRHDAQAAVVIFARLCCKTLYHLFLQHKVHVADEARETQ